MTGGVALIVVCELVEVEGPVPVGEIRTVTTDYQTNHNDNYVNYSTLPLLNTITQKCNFLFSIILLISHKRYKKHIYINYKCTLYYVHVTNLI